MTSPGNLRQRTLHSLGWQLVGTGGQRLVQLGGLAAMTRLLPKADVGLFAIVLAGVAAIDALTAFTGEQSQIHSKRGADRDYLDTVFTVRLIRGALVAGLIAALAPVFAWFFAEPEHEGRYWLTGLFLLLSANGLCDAIQSPARAVRMKALDFRRVACGDFAAALIGTGTQIALAIAWRDIWALVAGQVVSTLARSLTSYAVAPYRPRLRIERGAFRELMTYTLGGAGTPFLLMLIAQAPALVLGKLYQDAMFAIYTCCERLSKLPEEASLRVLAPVAIPAYAKLHGDDARLAQAWLKAIRGILMLGLPGTAVLVWIGNELPAVVFGDGYGAIAMLFPLLAVRSGIVATNAVIGPLFWAIGEPWKDRNVQLLRCVLLYGLGIPMAIRFGPAGFAGAAALAIFVALLLSLWFVLRRLRLPLQALASAAADGLSQALCLLAALLVCDWAFDPTGGWRLALGGSMGAFVVGRALLRSSRRTRPLRDETAPA